MVILFSVSSVYNWKIWYEVVSMSQLGNLYAFHFLFASFLFFWTSWTRLLLSLALEMYETTFKLFISFAISLAWLFWVFSSNLVLIYCSFRQSAELFECLRRLQLMALSVETLKVWSFAVSRISSSICLGCSFFNLFRMGIIDCFRPQRLESQLILSESTTQRIFGIYPGHWLSK